MLKDRVFTVVLIVVLLVLGCVSTVYLAACGGSPPDPIYATIDSGMFVPQIYVDDAHDVVCYHHDDNMACVYFGAR